MKEEPTRDPLWNYRKPSRHLRTASLVTGGALLVFVFGAVFTVVKDVQRHRELSVMNWQLEKMRRLGMALSEFEREYGGIPASSTAARVKQDTHTALTLGDATSNDLLKQLIAAEIPVSEEMFHMPGGSSKMPDNLVDTDAHALSAGECGLAYVPFASATDPLTPVLIGPAIAGRQSFNRDTFDGKVIVLRKDGSVALYTLRQDGHIAGPGGMDIFDPRQPFWNGTSPEVKWPK